MKQICKIIVVSAVGAAFGYVCRAVHEPKVKKINQECEFLEVDKNEASRIIADPENSPRGRFWLYEDGGYVGIDNHTHDAWTEDFSTKAECFGWLAGTEIE